MRGAICPLLHTPSRRVDGQKLGKVTRLRIDNKVCVSIPGNGKIISSSSEVQNNSEKIFVSRKIRQRGHSLAEVSLHKHELCIKI